MTDPENDDAKIIRFPGWQEAPSTPGGQARQCEHMVAIAFGYFACSICGPLEPTDA
jgi:hypothetical protein